MSFIGKILLWFAKWLPWLATGIAWFNKAFNFVMTKLLTAYFGSRLAITITLLTFAGTLIYFLGEVGGIFGTFVGTLVLSKIHNFDNDLAKFLFDYIDLPAIFNALFFFISTWSAYFSCCKSLWVFKKSVLLLRMIHQSIK